ncbi:MAG: hypothetical protein CL983_06005 [Euryarchaeota archaeon]|nr:hypothetical protein [Euryarchaeota archaeon]|tara:strand:- start:989 stop:4168 length:3180 start_codon:yes stop_codon:yes gene_type:complete
MLWKKHLNFLFIGVLFLLSIPSFVSAEVTVIPTANLGTDYMLLLPAGLGLFGTIFLAWYILPNSLSSLQVAFEADDNLFEVHRLTKKRSDARELLWLKGVPRGVLTYLMAMTALSILICELLIGSNTYYLPVTLLMAACVILPVLVSPLETLIAQLDQLRTNKIKGFFAFIRRIWAILIISGSTLGIVMYGLRRHGTLTPTWITLALLVFMSPTIFAYGRILGASWNMLLLSKWRSVRGRQTPINPDKPGFFGRISAFILVIFLFTMPFTATNGVFTVLYVTFSGMERELALNILNYGGVGGWYIVESSQMQALIEQYQYLKSVPQILAMFLTLNIAIVGLAFIFELIRNLFLGGQSFGGTGGVSLAATREIRSEGDVQGRLLYFAFAGFSGYTVLLVVLACYKEFGSLMPFTDLLEDYGFVEYEILRTTWTFIATGQAIFLLIWILSIWKFFPLKNHIFDLSPDERRAGAFRRGTNDWMQKKVDNAVRKDDLDFLITFQGESIQGDQSLVRLAKTKAKMYEYALRGLWPKAITEARNVLAQQGGEDDDARLLIGVGHVACRRIDAAREALSSLENEDDFSEPEVISFIADYFNPWQGRASDDDLWDFKGEPMIDNLTDMMERFGVWSPDSLSPLSRGEKDLLVEHNELMQVAMLRGQREHTMALEKAFSIVRRKPQMVKARVSLALCLLDQGEWHLALDVYESLAEMAAADPRTEALGEILGVPTRGYDELSAPVPHEVLLSSRRENTDKKYLSKLKPYLKEAPTNASIGLHFKKQKDVSLTANAMIAADQSVMRGVEPKYRVSNLVLFIRIFILWPSFVAAGWWVSENQGESFVFESIGQFLWPIVTGSLFFTQYLLSRIRRAQRRIIRQTDQKAMIAYSKRLKRSRVDLNIDKVPIGNHMLMSGILVTISNAVYDLGLPGWLTVRLDKPKNLRSNLRSRSKQIRSSKSARYKNLPYEWWKNQPRALSKESQELKKKIGLVLQDFGGKKSQHKKLRQKSRNMSSLGLDGDSIIYTGEKKSSSDGRKKKRGPPSRKSNGGGTGDDFDIESFLDSKRRR